MNNNLEDVYLIYLRKSRKDIEAELSGEGETLKRHEKILTDLTSKMGINIPEENIFREIVSGETIASRPEMQKVLSLVESGTIKGVLVMEVERLARGDTIDQGIVAQTFKYSSTKIITPMKTYDPDNEFDEEYFEFGLFMSRREYKTTNRRLQRGRKQSIAEGKYIHSVAPYGYKRVKLHKEKGFTLEEVPDESKIVKLIFDWYTREQLQENGQYERFGISIIVNQLNSMKVPTRKGGDWTTSTVRDILTNPVYVGLIKDGFRPQVKKVVDGEIVIERPRAKEKDIALAKGLHPGIIDEDTYNLAQQYLSKNPAMPIPSRHTVKNPLAGLIICKLCNRRMNRKPYTNGQPSSLLCTGPTCTNISSPLYLVEERVLSSLEALLKDYKLKYRHLEKSDNTLENEIINKAIKDIDAELETLNTQLNNMYDLLEQNVYSTEVFIKRSKIVSNKIDSLNKDKNNLLKKIDSKQDRASQIETLIPKIKNVIKVYWTLEDPSDKNKLLKEVIEKAVYYKKVKGRWHNKPDEFELEIYPKLR